MTPLNTILISLLFCPTLFAFAYPPQIKDARVEVYRTVADTELKLYLLGESDLEHPKPAIIFFFGGGWKGGSPEQFQKQSRHLAKRGMIAICADYRVNKRQGVKPVECVKDGKACLAWVRANSKRLGIDPNRICAAGGSAGGHVAACTGTLSGLGSDERPNAMILFNPVTLLADLGEWKVSYGKNRDLGIKPELLSPCHHIGKHTPPTLIMHGTGDTTVDFQTARAFETILKKANRPVTLVSYPKQGHGFFNRGKNFTATLAESDRFLVALGWLPPLK